jgi:hypothetical protein
MIDSMAGLILTKLGVPARVGGIDLEARRKAEVVVPELRREIAEAASGRTSAASRRSISRTDAPGQAQACGAWERRGVILLRGRLKSRSCPLSPWRRRESGHPKNIT